ncbi:winged helix-turn-helix transcriptional regulator [Candidatus Methanoprimaticola sp. MG2]|uniref:winged helix-turn-helix transcriptional regulator n=1 Tax=Candidatus Methanoprimaticola sp. MG2 TaxID=3228838 RepID=UPI0039C72150
MSELPECPVELTVSLVGDRWKILILRDLRQRTMRFSELRESVPGISSKVLTNRLRELETDGLISRQAFAEIPPRVEHSVTDLGRSFTPIFETMCSWGEWYRENHGRSARIGHPRGTRSRGCPITRPMPYSKTMTASPT